MREWTEKHIRELVRQEAEGLDLGGESSTVPYKYWELTDPFIRETMTEESDLFYYKHERFGELPQDIKCTIILEEGRKVGAWKEIDAFYFFHEPENKNITRYLSSNTQLSMVFRMSSRDAISSKIDNYLSDRYGIGKWTRQDRGTAFQHFVDGIETDALVYKTLDFSPTKISTSGELATVAKIHRLGGYDTPFQFAMSHNSRFYLENIEKYFMYIQRFMLISVRE